MKVTGVDIMELMKKDIVVYKEYRVLRASKEPQGEFVDTIIEKLDLPKTYEEDNLYIFSKNDINLVYPTKEKLDIYNKELSSIIDNLFENINVFEKDKVVYKGKDYYNLQEVFKEFDRYQKLNFKEDDLVGDIGKINKIFM